MRSLGTPILFATGLVAKRIGVPTYLPIVFVEDTDREDKVAVYEVSSEEELIEISNQLKAELVIEHPLDQDTEAYIKSEAR